MAKPMVNKEEHHRHLGELARMRADKRLMERLKNMESANEYFYIKIHELRDRVAELERLQRQ
jgi:mannitol/fructose-specific phosphotransferase system IIA component (Ntr-type)